MNDSELHRGPFGAIYQHVCHPMPGTAITVAMDGHRPLLTEIQALAAGGRWFTRRVVTGLVKLPEHRGGHSQSAPAYVTTDDAYVSTVGGISVNPQPIWPWPQPSFPQKRMPLPRSTITIGELSCR